jgi:hypothetical protein
VIPVECVQTVRHSNVCVEELRRKVVFPNPTRIQHKKIQVDGCVITEGTRADCAVEKYNVGTIIIEFKGRDVEHAADQIIHTARYWTNTLKTKLPIAGLIVGRQYPKAAAGIQRKQAAFAKEFKGPLRVMNKGGVVSFEEALAFP